MLKYCFIHNTEIWVRSNKFTAASTEWSPGTGAAARTNHRAQVFGLVQVQGGQFALA